MRNPELKLWLSLLDSRRKHQDVRIDKPDGVGDSLLETKTPKPSLLLAVDIDEIPEHPYPLGPIYFQAPLHLSQRFPLPPSPSSE